MPSGSYISHKESICHMLAVYPIRKVYSISEIFGSCINSTFCGSGECPGSSRSIEMMVTKDGSNLDKYGQTNTTSHWQLK